MKYERLKMKRDARQKCSLFLSQFSEKVSFLRKRLHFCRASLFIFGRSYFVRALNLKVEIISRGSTWNFAHDTFFLMFVPLWDSHIAFITLRTQEISHPIILREVMCQVLHRFNLGNEIIPSISFIGIGNLPERSPWSGQGKLLWLEKCNFFICTQLY